MDRSPSLELHLPHSPQRLSERSFIPLLEGTKVLLRRRAIRGNSNPVGGICQREHCWRARPICEQWRIVQRAQTSDHHRAGLRRPFHNRSLGHEVRSSRRPQGRLSRYANRGRRNRDEVPNGFILIRGARCLSYFRSGVRNLLRGNEPRCEQVITGRYVAYNKPVRFRGGVLGVHPSSIGSDRSGTLWRCGLRSVSPSRSFRVRSRREGLPPLRQNGGVAPAVLGGRTSPTGWRASWPCPSSVRQTATPVRGVAPKTVQCPNQRAG